jgi:hypothetical protein
MAKAGIRNGSPSTFRAPWDLFVDEDKQDEEVVAERWKQRSMIDSL